MSGHEEPRTSPAARLFQISGLQNSVHPLPTSSTYSTRVGVGGKMHGMAALGKGAVTPPDADVKMTDKAVRFDETVKLNDVER